MGRNRRGTLPKITVHPRSGHARVRYNGQEIWLGKNGSEEAQQKYNAMDVPPCIHCESPDTASVQCGVIRLTMALSANCRKFKLIGNGPKLAEWYCNECEQFFNEDGTPTLPEDCEQEPQNAEECIEAMKKHGGFTITFNKLLEQ